MKRMRGMFVGLALAVLAIGLPADAAVRSLGQTKKTSTSSTSNQTVLQKMGSATSGFFRGVADTLTLKKFSSKNKTSTARK